MKNQVVATKTAAATWRKMKQDYVCYLIEIVTTQLFHTLHPDGIGVAGLTA